MSEDTSSVNSLSGNGAWSLNFVENASDGINGAATDYYNIVNKTYNSGDNFLSWTTEETPTGTGNNYVQVCNAEDADNTKATRGSWHFEGPLNYTINTIESGEAYQATDSITNEMFNMYALKLLLALDNIDVTG